MFQDAAAKNIIVTGSLHFFWATFFQPIFVVGSGEPAAQALRLPGFGGGRGAHGHLRDGHPQRPSGRRRCGGAEAAPGDAERHASERGAQCATRHLAPGELTGHQTNQTRNVIKAAKVVFSIFFLENGDPVDFAKNWGLDSGGSSEASFNVYDAALTTTDEIVRIDPRRIGNDYNPRRVASSQVPFF